MPSPVIYAAQPAFAGQPGAFELAHRLTVLRASLSEAAAILLDQILEGTTAEKPGSKGSSGGGRVSIHDISIMKVIDRASP
jgi:hypothetical protein